MQIRIPQLVDYNTAQNYLVKEYIAGKTAAELISEMKLTDAMLEQLFKMSYEAEKHSINIDYFPTNFVLQNADLVYIDYEINPYDTKWNFAEWGIYYWANAQGMSDFLKNGNYTAINQANTGIPIKTPFETIKRLWLERFKIT